MSPASAISIPMVKVMPCTAVTNGLVNRRCRPNGSIAAAGRAGVGIGTEEQWHLQPGGGVVTGEDQHADEQLGIVVEAGVGRRELVADLRGERVLLLDPVDGHHQDPVVDDLGVHLPVRVTVHGWSPPLLVA